MIDLLKDLPPKKLDLRKDQSNKYATRTECSTRRLFGSAEKNNHLK
jgi:hypothetical protein